MAKVVVRDVCPRDGLQDISTFVSTSTKVDLIQKLDEVGVSAIEATSFVSPKVIPQLADAETVLSDLAERGGVSSELSAFVATASGLSRALAAGISEVATTVPATDSMTQANFRRSRAEMLDAVIGMRRDAPTDLKMSITIAVAFGCPYDGEVSADEVLVLVDELAQNGYHTVLLGDTVGVANPLQVANLVGSIAKRFPELEIGGHFHDSRGAGVANVVAAVDSGAALIDASVAGLGGCPFAPGAAGNVATEDVVWLLESMGFDTGISVPGIVDVARWTRAALGISARSRTPEAVRFAWEPSSSSTAA